MLPKPVYELLPFVCLISGALMAIFANTNLLFIAGLGLYAGGAAIRILRSYHRRLDARENKRQQKKLRYNLSISSSLPEPLYESLPYLYMAVAFVLFRATDELILQGVAGVFLCAGISVLFIRRKSRINKTHCEKHLES